VKADDPVTIIFYPAQIVTARLETRSSSRATVDRPQKPVAQVRRLVGLVHWIDWPPRASPWATCLLRHRTSLCLRKQRRLVPVRERRLPNRNAVALLREDAASASRGWGEFFSAIHSYCGRTSFCWTQMARVQNGSQNALSKSAAKQTTSAWKSF